MRKRTCLRLALAASTGLLVNAAVAETNRFLPNPKLLNAELLARGKVVYQNHCSGCHGEKGDGKGPGAYGLFPKPRDFTTGIYKFRSTPPGSLPTDEDLVRSVRQGILGTSMPPFDLMPEPDVLAVAQYLKTFSLKWHDPESYSDAVHVPNPPSWMKDSAERETRAAKGKELYLMACVACHGPKGDGRGLAAATLVNSWNEPVPPADLRKPYIRSGRNLTDIYKVLVTGMDGTPMPSMADALNEEQRWELVAFIQQLREHKKAGLSGPAAILTPAENSTPDSSVYE